MNTSSKIYVAGHRGLVGSAIVRELESRGYTNIITRKHSELDLLNQAAVNDFFSTEKPDYVFLAAAHVAGVDRIFKIGGAQAVAALAYGTETIPKVDKIVGPGNAFVAEAKKQVFGKVSIDMIAGPSEILVVADDTNNPDIIAADLLSQAEHDKNASAVLVTDSMDFALKVSKSLEKQIPKKCTDGFHTGKFIDGRCPACSFRQSKGDIQWKRQFNKYCRNCGQALDWGDSE